MRSVEDRLWERLREVGECWIFTGYVNEKGYGRIGVSGRTRPAHRVAYEYVVGVVPAGLELDHLCRNRACCNPAHLEPVTHRENVRRGASPGRKKTKCPMGHDYTGDNLYLTSNGGQACRRCKARQQREYRARKVAAC